MVIKQLSSKQLSSKQVGKNKSFLPTNRKFIPNDKRFFFQYLIHNKCTKLQRSHK